MFTDKHIHSAAYIADFYSVALAERLWLHMPAARIARQRAGATTL